MKTFNKLIIYGVGLALVQLMAVAPAMSAMKTYTMTGKITAIDQQDKTLVVNVPEGKNTIFTVAGPLASNANLEKAGKKVSLNHFSNGEQVTVKWMPVKNGHEILDVMANK